MNEVNGPSESKANGLSVNEVNGLLVSVTKKSFERMRDKNGPKNKKIMSFLRVILAIFFPPLAVIDKGCGSVLIVLLLTCCGWVPGVIGALVILNKNEG